MYIHSQLKGKVRGKQFPGLSVDTCQAPLLHIVNGVMPTAVDVFFSPGKVEASPSSLVPHSCTHML